MRKLVLFAILCALAAAPAGASDLCTSTYCLAVEAYNPNVNYTLANVSGSTIRQFGRGVRRHAVRGIRLEPSELRRWRGVVAQSDRRLRDDPEHRACRRQRRDVHHVHQLSADYSAACPAPYAHLLPTSSTGGSRRASTTTGRPIGACLQRVQRRLLRRLARSGPVRPGPRTGSPHMIVWVLHLQRRPVLLRSPSTAAPSRAQRLRVVRGYYGGSAVLCFMAGACYKRIRRVRPGPRRAAGGADQRPDLRPCHHRGLRLDLLRRCQRNSLECGNDDLYDRARGLPGAAERDDAALPQSDLGPHHSSHGGFACRRLRLISTRSTATSATR